MNNLYRLLIALIFCFIGNLSSVEAQRKKAFKPKQRFLAGVIAGVNTSQIDGDYYSGYDKPGFFIGAQGAARLTRDIDLVVELLYNQKGSFGNYKPGAFAVQKRPHELELHYAEVPFLIRFNRDQELFRIELGFSYARLIQTNITEQTLLLDYNYTDISDQFNTNEFNLIAGLGFNLFKNFSVGSRFNVAATKMYFNDEFEEYATTVRPYDNFEPFAAFRNYQFMFYANYRIY